MNHIRTEKLQFGQTGWILGDLPNLLAGSMEVDIYSCPKCKKVEFFLADETEEGMPQKQCPNCGKMHDFDYPKCPFCKFDYNDYSVKLHFVERIGAYFYTPFGAVCLCGLHRCPSPSLRKERLFPKQCRLQKSDL